MDSGAEEVGPAIRCVGLRKSFDSVSALDIAQLEIWSPKITAIIGPNGAGKTTFLNVLSGLTRPDAGQCYIGQHDVKHLSPHQIARIGVGRTFQEVRLILG